MTKKKPMNIKCLKKKSVNLCWVEKKKNTPIKY